MSLPTFQYNPGMISILPREERFRQILPAHRTVLKHYSFFYAMPPWCYTYCCPTESSSVPWLQGNLAETEISSLVLDLDCPYYNSPL